LNSSISKSNNYDDDYYVPSNQSQLSRQSRYADSYSYQLKFIWYARACIQYSHCVLC
jgi:hypothetical protein